MTLTNEDLSNLLEAGAVADIFKAERAYAVLKTIGEHADAINGSETNFGELFGTIQNIAQTEALLSVARLYDPPSKRYPTRCLRGLLDDLEAHAADLPSMIGKLDVLRDLGQLGMQDGDVRRLQCSIDADVTRAMAGFLRTYMEEPGVNRAVECLKNVRDKWLAHNEDAHDVTGPTWSAMLDLLTLAKRIVGIVGGAYLGVAYVVDDGTYLLSGDAERPGLAMKRLLEKLGIIEPRFPRST